MHVYATQCAMLDTTSPYLTYIIISYALAALVMGGMLCIQLRQHRKARRQLEMLDGMSGRGEARSEMPMIGKKP